MRLTAVLFQMSQIRSAKRVCKNPGRKAYYLTKSCNDVPTRGWLYRDGAARKVLGDRDFVFGDELTRENRRSNRCYGMGYECVLASVLMDYLSVACAAAI